MAARGGGGGRAGCATAGRAGVHLTRPHTPAHSIPLGGGGMQLSGLACGYHAPHTRPQQQCPVGTGTCGPAGLLYTTRPLDCRLLHGSPHVVTTLTRLPPGPARHVGCHESRPRDDVKQQPCRPASSGVALVLLCALHHEVCPRWSRIPPARAGVPRHLRAKSSRALVRSPTQKEGVTSYSDSCKVAGIGGEQGGGQGSGRPTES